LAAYMKWGDKFAEKLQGMFALAIYDSRTDTVLLCRDRAGEKPLYYSFLNNQLRFASELKGLFADQQFGREIDESALNCYLEFGYVPGAACLIKNCRKLPPAHLLKLDIAANRVAVRRYWDLPFEPRSGRT